MSDFQYLFTPVKFGNTELPSRLLLSPHTLNVPRGSDQEIEYLRTRLNGGAAAVFLTCTRVSDPLLVDIGIPNLLTEEGREANRRTIDALHADGAKVFVQTHWMPGYETVQPSKEMPWSTGTPRSASAAELYQVIDQAVESIVGCKEVGFDGVQFYIGCGVSFHTLMDPIFNRRTDEFGGSEENRLRVMVEILKRAREACGKDFTIGMLLDVDEEFLGGMTLDESVEVARYLTEVGDLDFINVNSRHVKVQEGHLHYPSSYMPQGLNMYAVAAVREAVDIPVIGSHHINSAEYAEQLIAEGQCDAVVMARPLICDPELPNKARRGESEDIRGCIGCCEGCYQRFTTWVPIGCSINPDAGHESEGDPFVEAEVKKNILVVGGGLAGCETALTAAKRGHKVTLMEKADKLGGYVELQSALPGLSDRKDICRWYGLQLEKEGVDVQLNTEATPESVKAFGADTVVIATGSNYSSLGISEHYLLPIPGHENDNVVTPEQIIDEGVELGDHVVVYDCTNYVVGPGIAEMLADQGKEVDVITYESKMACSLEPCFVDTAVNMRVLPKVNHIPNTAILEVEDDEVTIRNRYTLEEETLTEVDNVVLVTSRPPNDELYLALQGEIDEIYDVGDCKMSHYHALGMYNATQAGRALGKAL